MKPVFQKVIAKGKGDCVRACYASLFEVELEEVPDFKSFSENNNTWLVQVDWITSKGYSCIFLDKYDLYPDRLGAVPMFFAKGIHCICTVPSQMFEGGTHAVIGKWTYDGVEIVHDPNPNNKPYSPEDILGYQFIVKL